MWPSVGNKQGWNAKVVHPQHIYEARKGEEPRQVAVLDVDRRRTMDAEIASRAVEFIKRNASAGKPFFAYVPFAQVHMPTRFQIWSSRAEPATAIGPIALPKWITVPGKSLMPSSKRASKTTRFSYSPATMARRRPTPWEGDNGPWRGTYFTAMEGSLRTPFIIRWPGKVPAGRVSNEIVHIVDLFSTLARVGRRGDPQGSSD
jgi:arylsulfatase